MQKTFTTKEAAEQLGVTESRVRQMIIDGMIDAERFGRSHVLTAASIREARKRKTARGPVAGKAAKR